MSRVIITYAITGILTGELDDEESDPVDWAIDAVLNTGNFSSRDVRVEIREVATGRRIA